jgi:hypothetical protein
MKSFNDFYNEQNALREGILGKIASIPGGIIKTAGKIIHAPDKFGAGLSRFVRTGEFGSPGDFDKYRRKEFNKQSKEKAYKLRTSRNKTIKRKTPQPTINRAK